VIVGLDDTDTILGETAIERRTARRKHTTFIPSSHCSQEELQQPTNSYDGALVSGWLFGVSREEAEGERERERMLYHSSNE